MSAFVKEYIAYLKDNPRGYWFMARWYGWGWVPAKRQGWLVLLVWLALLLFFSLTIDENSSLREVAFTFLLPIVILTTSLICICWKKGERPRWNWGDPRKR